MGKILDKPPQPGGRALSVWGAVVALLAGVCSAVYVLYTSPMFEATESMLAAAILFVAAAQIFGLTYCTARRVFRREELSDLIKTNAFLVKEVQVLTERLDNIDMQGNDKLDPDLERMGDKIGSLEERITDMGRILDSQPATPIENQQHNSPPRGFSSPPPSSFAMTATPGLVERALEARATAVYLQPIVNLATHKTSAYEATLKLLGTNGKPFQEQTVADIITSKKIEVDLDLILVEKAIRIATHFRNRKRKVPVICRLCIGSLADNSFLDFLLNSLSMHKELAEAILLAMSQSDLALLSTQALEGVASLNDLGFRFVMDDLADVKAKPDILKRAGFIMVRSQAAFFSRNTADRDAECLTMLGKFRQSGLIVTANGLNNDADVGMLLNGVDNGQGSFFSDPRMVRAELTETGSEQVSAKAG